VSLIAIHNLTNKTLWKVYLHKGFDFSQISPRVYSQVL
jgi:hypothetical protein